MDHYLHEWPQKKDTSGVIIVMVSIIGICVIAFTLMSIGNYHGASYAFASAQWGEILVNFWTFIAPALPG